MDRTEANLFSRHLTSEAYSENYLTLIGEGVRSKGNEYEVEVDVEENDTAKTIAGKIAIKLIALIEEKTSKINTIDISESKGDIKKLKYNKHFEDVAQLLESLQSGHDMGSKYIDIYLDNYDMMIKNRNKFRKAFKSSDKNLLALYYISSILYHIEMTSILSSALVVWVENGDDIDKYIQHNKSFKKIFLQVEDIINDDDLVKFLNVDFNKRLISESNMTGQTLILYSETSLSDTISLFKLGLAKFLYKITGFIRFIIYTFHYSKYSLEKRMDKINTVLDLYREDDSDRRVQLAKEAGVMKKEFKIDSIETENTVEKTIDREKVDLEDTEGFSL